MDPSSDSFGISHTDFTGENNSFELRAIDTSVDDENDRVVRKIGVFLSRWKVEHIENDLIVPDATTDSDVYVMQYPLRPFYRPYNVDLGSIENALYCDPDCFRFVYGLQTETVNTSQTNYYNNVKSETNDSNDANRRHSHTIQSTASDVENHCSYAVGFMRDGALYVTPVKRVIQFRPISSVEASNQSSSTKKQADNFKSQASAHPNVNAPVVSRFGSEGQRPRPSAVRERESQAAWIVIEKLKFCDEEVAYMLNCIIENLRSQSINQAERHDYVDRALCNVGEAEFDPSVNCYVDSLCATASKHRLLNDTEDKSKTNVTGAMSYLSLYRLSVNEQVLRILKHMSVVTTKTVLKTITVSASETEIMPYLKIFARLVLGNWVINSEIILDPKVNAYEILCRDLLIVLLIGGQKGAGISREPFFQATKLPPEVGNVYFSELAEYRSTGWYLKLSPDEDFLSKFPKEAQYFETWWKERQSILVKGIAASRHSGKMST